MNALAAVKAAANFPTATESYAKVSSPMVDVENMSGICTGNPLGLLLTSVSVGMHQGITGHGNSVR